MKQINTGRSSLFASLLAAGIFLSAQAQAHFGMIIPSDDMVRQDESRHLKLDVMFWHPFEGHGMNLARPEQFGVMVDGKRHDLLPRLEPVKRTDSNGKQRDGFLLKYGIKKPGDHSFYMVPQPYWEPAEESFIIHYTKVIVNAFGLEEGWDQPVGLKTEIVPLSRPYGLYAGNLMRGQVLVDGKPVGAGVPVEVEYFNEDHSLHAEADPLITQVVLTDDKGLFAYSMPRAGWWGFAALSEGKDRKHEGKSYPTEIGAVLWVKTHEMK